MAALVLTAAAANAIVDSELDFHRGVAAFAEEKYDQAEGLFESVLEVEPEDSAALRYLGLIAQAQGETEKALGYFRRAVASSPDDLEARVDLAEVFLQAGRAEAAQGEAEFVLKRDPEDPRAQLYAGIAAYRLRQYERSLAHLERAIELDTSTQVEARYYIGLNEAFLGNFGAATAAFSDAEEGSPNSPIGRSAQDLAARVAPGEPGWWAADASAGLEFDSNPKVVNDDFNKDPDGAGVFRLRGRARAPEWNDITARVGYDGYLNAHFDVTDVDQQTHLLWTAAVWDLDPFEVGLRYDFALTALPLDDLFRTVNRITPHAGVRWDDWGLTQLYYVFNYYDYDNNVESEFDRTGDQHTVGANQFLFLPEWLDPLTFARFGVAGTISDPKGREYVYDGVEVLAGGGAELPFDIDVNAFYRFIYRNYAHDSAFEEDTKRRDHLHWLSAEVTYGLTDRWTLGLNGSFLFNDSNVNEFEYDRQIVTSYVRYSF